jgi:hypothetical protein
MNKVPFNSLIKANFVINYIELLEREFYNIQRDLLLSKKLPYIDKRRLIHKRCIINNNINLGYGIIKNDIFKNEVKYEEMLEYVKDTSAIIRKNYDKTLLQKYKEMYNIDITEFTDRVMLDKYE